MIFYLAFKNIISRKSSLVIIAFISLAAMLFAFSNAVFDSTENGVQETFCSSFTGDLIIRPVSNVPLSLFGDETPVTGMLTKINSILPYHQVSQAVSSCPYVSASVPQVSSTAILENGKKRLPVFLFGTDFPDYSRIMSSIKIIEGRGFDFDEEACMIQSSMAKEAGIKAGSKVQFMVADGISFRIRSLTVSGIYEYAFSHSSLNKIVIASPQVVRELAGTENTVSLDYDFSDSVESLLDSDLNEDDFFFSEDLDDFDIEITESQTQDYSSQGSWNFIICKSDDARKAVYDLNSSFKNNGWPVEAVLWRDAAGSSALYIYWLRIIFNAGILIILASGFIVVNNTLVIHVIDRTREIGTLRAMGASSFFVSAECLMENLILSLVSAFTGIIFSFILCALVNKVGFQLHNDFLIQLFGSEPLCFSIRVPNIISVFILCLLLAFIGWILPVRNALSVEPVKAIQGAK
ncbi:FtsX-like permease family protein [Treponema sp.]|uniref:ABC transporter permease n=1 Tax=Treponema sp. TaxID=166 RepID=UPI0025F14198|nr:FtsX-like permease family protein [Treponema sp.]MCR5217749.1 FtsX-like permease family protein [Treponema sp.]